MMTRSQIIAYTIAKLGISEAAVTTKAGTFLDMRHSMIWNDSDWKQARVEEAVPLVAGTQDYTLGSTVEFIKVARLNGLYDLTVLADVTALQKMPSLYDANGPTIAIVPLPRTGGAVKIRVVGKPTQAGTLLIVGKAKLTALADADEPPIPGEDIALCEYVLADLYEWLRQFDTAKHYMEKAGFLLAKMKEIETVQAGEMRQIIPHVQMLEGEGGYDSLNPLG